MTFSAKSPTDDAPLLSRNALRSGGVQLGKVEAESADTLDRDDFFTRPLSNGGRPSGLAARGSARGGVLFFP